VGKFGNVTQTILIRVLLVIVLLFALTIQSSCVGTVSAEKESTIELKLAHFFPGTHPAETEFVQGGQRPSRRQQTEELLLPVIPVKRF